MNTSWLIVAIVLTQWILANIVGVVAFVMAFSSMRHNRATAVLGAGAVLYGIFLAAFTFRPWVHIIPLDALTFAPIVAGGIALWRFGRNK
jgi:uncharacterized membrane protein